MTFRRGEGVVGWVVDQGVPARINDAAADPRFEERALNDLLEGR